MQLNEIVRDNILKITQTKNLKVSDLQRKSNFSENTIYKYLNGSRRISLNVLDVFSEILNVNSKLLIDKNLVVKKTIEIIIKEKD